MANKKSPRRKDKGPKRPEIRRDFLESPKGEPAPAPHWRKIALEWFTEHYTWCAGSACILEGDPQPFVVASYCGDESSISFHATRESAEEVAAVLDKEVDRCYPQPRRNWHEVHDLRRVRR